MGRRHLYTETVPGPHFSQKLGSCVLSILVEGSCFIRLDFLTYLAYAWASYQIRTIAGFAWTGNAGTFSPPPRVSDPDMHYGTCVRHVPWCMPGSLTSGFCRWRGKRSRHNRRLRNPQFYASGKRPTRKRLQIYNLKTNVEWTSSKTFLNNTFWIF